MSNYLINFSLSLEKRRCASRKKKSFNVEIKLTGIQMIFCRCLDFFETKFRVGKWQSTFHFGLDKAGLSAAFQWPGRIFRSCEEWSKSGINSGIIPTTDIANTSCSAVQRLAILTF
jgi:hypothetical protein